MGFDIFVQIFLFRDSFENLLSAEFAQRVIIIIIS